jgi:hypothetical protein
VNEEKLSQGGHLWQIPLMCASSICARILHQSQMTKLQIATKPQIGNSSI